MMRKALLALIAFTAAFPLAHITAAQSRLKKAQIRTWELAPKDPINPDEKIFAIDAGYYGTFTPTLRLHLPYSQMYCSNRSLEYGLLNTALALKLNQARGT
jgi:hypothetical protein